MTTETGSCCDRRPRVPPDVRRQRQQQRAPRHGKRQADDALHRSQLAVVVEPLDRLDQLRRRLIALRGIGLDAARDQLIEGLRHLRDERSHRGRRLRQTPLQLADGADRMLGAAPAGQHVVDDQPERVDVGALIDVLAARLLGRHVFDGADDLAGDRRGGLRDVIAVDRDVERSGAAPPTPPASRRRATSSARCRSP